MKMKSAAALAAACTLALTVTAAEAKTTWDMSLAWPEGNFHTKDAHDFAKAVSDATGGEVEITVQSGGALGIKGPEAMAAVRDGIVPIADVLLNQQVGEAPILGIESLPYLAPTLPDLALLHKFFRPAVDEVAAKMNQKVLYVVPWPGQAVYSPNRIDTLDDLKGLSIRVVDANGSNFFKALGATPVQMPWGEVVPALAAGTIKGVTTSSSSGVDGAFWQFTRHMTRFNWQSSSDAVSVNLDAWNELSPENQKAIEAVAKKMEAQFWVNSANEDTRQLAKLKDNGIEIADPSPELRAALLEKAKPLWADFEAKVPAAKPVIDDYLLLLK